MFGKFAIYRRVSVHGLRFHVAPLGSSGKNKEMHSPSYLPSEVRLFSSVKEVYIASFVFQGTLHLTQTIRSFLHFSYSAQTRYMYI